MVVIILNTFTNCVAMDVMVVVLKFCVRRGGGGGGSTENLHATTCGGGGGGSGDDSKGMFIKNNVTCFLLFCYCYSYYYICKLIIPTIY